MYGSIIMYNAYPSRMNGFLMVGDKWGFFLSELLGLQLVAREAVSTLGWKRLQ